MAQFDPYTEWLELADKRRPPTHYSILGVKQGEARADVIEKHAEQQKQRLAQYLQGPNARLAKRLAFEIEAARSCLTDAERRAVYQRTLGAAHGKGVGTRAVSLRPAGPPKAAGPSAAGSAAPDVAGKGKDRKPPLRASGRPVDTAARPVGPGQTPPSPPKVPLRGAARAAVSSRWSQRQMMIAAIAVAVIAVVTIGTATWLRQSPDRSVAAESSPETKPATLPLPLQAEQPSGEEPSDEQPSDQQPSDQQPSDQQPSDQQPSDQQPPDQQPPDEQPTDEQPVGDGAPQPQPDEPSPLRDLGSTIALTDVARPGAVAPWRRWAGFTCGKALACGCNCSAARRRWGAIADTWSSAKRRKTTRHHG